MAYLDNTTVLRKKQCAEKYEHLKKHITSKDDNMKLNEWFLAHEHMVDLETQLVQYKKQVEEYQKFFKMMSSLLPKEPTINDTIG